MISETATAEGQARGRQRKWSRAVGALAVLGVLGLLALLLAAALPRLWGYQSYVIYGSSMEPAIKLGSLVVAEPVNVDDLQVGDIIAFRSPNEVTVTHRIVGVREEDGQRYFQTKGDASNDADPQDVSLENSAQQVAYHVPYLGYFVHFAKSTTGIILLIALPALGLLALHLTNSRKAAGDA